MSLRLAFRKATRDGSLVDIKEFEGPRLLLLEKEMSGTTSQAQVLSTSRLTQSAVPPAGLVIPHCAAAQRIFRGSFVRVLLLHRRRSDTIFTARGGCCRKHDIKPP